MPGARRRERPRTAWMDNIKTWTGLSVGESIRMTEDRDIWSKCVHGQPSDLGRLKNRTECERATARPAMGALDNRTGCDSVAAIKPAIKRRAESSFSSRGRFYAGDVLIAPSLDTHTRPTAALPAIKPTAQSRRTTSRRSSCRFPASACNCQIFVTSCYCYVSDRAHRFQRTN